MLTPFFYLLRAAKIPVGISEWMVLLNAIVDDLHECSLDRFYHLARAILVKSESLYDAYDQVFLTCFKGVEGKVEFKKELLDWLNKNMEGKERPPIPDIPPLSLEELRKRLLERLREQKAEHHGGNKWVGTGGTSPFGHGGSHPSGVRIGGPGGGRSAVKVAEERRFASYREDRILDTRQFKVALKRLRKLEQIGVKDVLSVDKTISETCKNAGEIELIFESARKNQTELILLMDVGGSMDPYVHLVEALFSAAHSVKHFKTFEHFYFHNCVYGNVYRDSNFTDLVPLHDIFHKYRKNTKIIFVGDASMNPYELFYRGGSLYEWNDSLAPGIESLQEIKERFPDCVWLNPEPQMYWQHVTISAIGKLIPMFPLTIAGLTEAVDKLAA